MARDPVTIEGVAPELLICNIRDFTGTARSVEQESEIARKGDGPNSVSLRCVSLKAVSHFNFGIALELLLKLLLLINHGKFPPIHELPVLYGKLPPRVQEELESTYQDKLKGGSYHLVALSKQPPPQQPYRTKQPPKSLKEVFAYFQNDARLCLQRYMSFELTNQGSVLYYVEDLSLFLEFIEDVLADTERYTAPDDGAEHGKD